MAHDHDATELQIRQYMEALFDRHLPKIISAAVSTHNDDINAHEQQIESAIENCPTAKKLDRLLALAVGLAFGLGLGSGAGLVGLLKLM